MCQEWKDKCDTALATPFPGDPLCFEKVCTYYAPLLMLSAVLKSQSRQAILLELVLATFFNPPGC